MRRFLYKHWPLLLWPFCLFMVQNFLSSDDERDDRAAVEAAAAAMMMIYESAQASHDDRNRRASTREENVFHFAFCHCRLFDEFFLSFDLQLAFTETFLVKGFSHDFRFRILL